MKLRKIKTPLGWAVLVTETSFSYAIVYHNGNISTFTDDRGSFDAIAKDLVRGFTHDQRNGLDRTENDCLEQKRKELKKEIFYLQKELAKINEVIANLHNQTKGFEFRLEFYNRPVC